MTQLRAVIYARYSSDLQSEASIEDQVRICKEKAEKEGWRVVDTYSDHAQSGSTNFRPRYQQLLADARLGKFDIVVAESLDRLSRDQENVAGLYKELQFSRVQLVTLADGLVSELHVGLKGTMNALFLKDLAAKTHRGLRGRVESGRSAGSISYGYRIRREFDAQGEPIRGGREINPDEARVIVRIFEMFTAGLSPRAIARTLNGEGVPGPRGENWRDTTIRGHAGRGTGILRNELYIGRLIWNRQKFVRDPQTGKRLSRPNPKSDWIIQAVPELRIVEQHAWDECARRLGELADSPTSKAIKAGKFWLKRRPKHFLSGVMCCGHCGSAMVVVGKDYFRCGSAHRNTGCSSTALVRRGIVEGLVLDGLKSQLMAPELVEEFSREFHRHIESLQEGRQSERAELERRLRKTDQQIETLVTAISEGLRGPSIQARLASLEAQKLEMQQRLSGQANNIIPLRPDMSVVYRRKIAALQEELEKQEVKVLAVESLRALLDKVIVLPSDTGVEIELVGDLPRMLAFANTENAAPGGTALSAEPYRSAKVVAGARFELTTFRL